MSRCSFCHSMVFFGGVHRGHRRYCSVDCERGDEALSLSKAVPRAIVDEHVRRVREGPCGWCGGNGAVDVFVSHRVWSFLVITSCASTPRISCRSCGIQAQLRGILFSMTLGWWGLPWGIFMTPVQIVRNLLALVFPPSARVASQRLREVVRISLSPAGRAIAARMAERL